MSSANLNNTSMSDIRKSTMHLRKASSSLELLEEKEQEDEDERNKLVETIQKSLFNLPIDIQREVFNNLEDDESILFSRASAWARGSGSFLKLSLDSGSIDERYQQSWFFTPSRFMFHNISLTEILSKVIRTDREMKKFRYVRYYAIMSLANSVKAKIKSFLSADLGETQYSGKETFEHFEVFSWFLDNFHERRKMKGTIWIEFMKKLFPSEYIEQFKYRYDVREIHEMMELLFKGFMFGNRKTSEEAREVIQGAYDYADIFKRIKGELRENILKFQRDLYQITNSDLKRRDTYGRQVMLEYESFKTSSQLLNPIIQRYNWNHNRVRVEQCEIKINMEEEKLEKQIDKIYDDIRMEEYFSQCSIDSEYATVNKHRTELEALDEEYAQRYDKAHTKGLLLKTKMEKLNERKAELVGKLENVRKKLQKHYEVEEINRKGEENLKLNLEKELMKEPELLTKSKKKSHKRKKSKKSE